MSRSAPRADGRVRPPKPPQSRLERALVFGLVLVMLAGGAGVIWLGQSSREGRPLPVEDRAADVADILVFGAVVPVGEEGWLAELPASWAGSPSELPAKCRRALERLGAAPNQTLTIVGPEGLPLAECGAE